MTAKVPCFIDIGVNLTDEMYLGKYHGKQAHPPDLRMIMERARGAGVVWQMVTVGQLSEVQPALDLCREYPTDLYCTVGVHPTRTSQIGEGDEYLTVLRGVLKREARTANKKHGRIIAIGECGLDYERLHFSDKDDQRKHFELQLQLAKEFKLPLFLHCRAAHQDLIDILRPHLQAISEALDMGPKPDGYTSQSRVGVVHCFTGSLREMEDLIDLGLFVGLTGCSFKTEEGIRVAKEIPLERLLLETDAPWCDMRSTHASSPLLAAFNTARPDLAQLYQPASVKKEKWDKAKMVKGRNEPCTIGHVAALVAQAKGVEIETVAEAAYNNSRFLFGI